MVLVYAEGQQLDGGPYFVNASLFLFNKLCPVSAPFSLAFIRPNDCRVGNTASRSWHTHALALRGPDEGDSMHGTNRGARHLSSLLEKFDKSFV